MSSNGSPPPEQPERQEERAALDEPVAEAQPVPLVTDVAHEAPEPRKQKPKFAHTSELQLEFLVQWLEQPGNFALLARPTRELVAECSSGNMKRPKKTDCYKSLAQYMNYKAQTKWTEKIACSRYKSFMASYYRAKRQRPLYLPPIYKRVDALVGGDFKREAKPEIQSESYIREMTKQEPSDSDVHMENTEQFVTNQPEALAMHDRESIKASESAMSARDSSPSTHTESMQEKGSVKTQEELTATKMSNVMMPMTDSMPLNEKMLWLESQRLAVKQQELELKQLKQTQRVEMIVKLAASGKSAEEVRQYLAVMDQFA